MSHSEPPTSAHPASRAVAPDLSRGLMLLLIALANVPWFLYGAPTSATSAHRTDASGLDAVWQGIAIVAVDGRSYPLFAFLFGYGIWQSYARQTGGDARSVRHTLQRRHVWLIVFGAIHAALLWSGDILGAYGLVGLLVVWLFLGRETTTLLRWAGALTGVLALVAVLVLGVGTLAGSDVGDVAGDGTTQLAAITPYTESVLPRLELWLPQTVLQGVLGLTVPVAVLLGIAAARHRVLESPRDHRALLVRTAVVGITVGWAGAVPSLLAHFGVWGVPEWVPSLLHLLTGLFAALGYAAALALAAARYTEAHRPGPVAGALTAVGKRSLTCYLLQSVVFAPLLCAWGLGLGAVLDQWQAALLAVATWLITVAIAATLERGGRRGPAEWLLRRLSARDPASATPVTR